MCKLIICGLWCLFRKGDFSLYYDFDMFEELSVLWGMGGGGSNMSFGLVLCECQVEGGGGKYMQSIGLKVEGGDFGPYLCSGA